MKPIRLAKSIIGIEESEAVRKVLLDDGYLGMGNEVKIFEEDISKFLEVSPQNVACVNTGTAAVHLAIQASLKQGDEILVQSLTFVASYQAISACGVIPVHCEVDPDTLTIDLNDAEKKITSKCKAIMAVHYASYPSELDEIYEFAKKHNLRVIEDAAHAFGCVYNGKKIGSIGDIICFSFDGIKNITSGEGGAVVSSDLRIMQLVRDARLLGVENDTEKRYSNQRSWDFDVKKQGYRFHMSNINAAIGRVQLNRLVKEFSIKRVSLAKLYRKNLEANTNIELLKTNLGDVIPHLQPIKVLFGKRDKLKNELEKLGIPTGIHYKPNHLLTFYGGGSESLPVTEKVYNEILSLPLHPEISENEVVSICDAVNRILNE